MPPVQTSRDLLSFAVDNYDVVILICATLSLSFILVVLLTWRAITRRRGIYRVLHRITTTPDLRSPRALNVRNETWSLHSVSALVLQSKHVPFRHLRFGIVPNNFWPSSAAHSPKAILSHNFEPEPPSRERINIRQFDDATSLPSGDDCSCTIQTFWFHPTTLCGLRKRLSFCLFAGSRQQDSSLTARKSEKSQRHTPDVVVVEPREDTDESEVDTGTLRIPLIILSLPSSENLVGDRSPPVSLDESFLCPDGTFRSSRPALAAGLTCYISDSTRFALASRLRHRQKRAVHIPSPDVLSNSSVVRWPRWF